MTNSNNVTIIASDEETNRIEKPSTVKRGSSALRGNLTRVQRDRDPLFYYQVEQILGIGSMGSVVKVRKREAVVGGSARQDLQFHYRKEKVLNQCFRLPLVGGLFRVCFKGLLHFKSNAYHTEEEDEAFFDSGHVSHNSHDTTPDYINASSPRSQTDMMYAMKSIHLSRVTDQRFLQELKNEVAILRDLDHPHIVKAIETFEHRNQLFIIMELCYGGDLYSRDPYTEEHAARITSSILSAIAYMHSKNILHRDLKYENVLFVNHSPQAEIKLIDFGLSAAFGHDELTDGVGTM
jgi:serine/threonine protein kinase